VSSTFLGSEKYIKTEEDTIFSCNVLGCKMFNFTLVQI
jgi:hypothetical protein